MPLSATLSATSQHQAQKSRHVAGSGGAAVPGIDVLHSLVAGVVGVSRPRLGQQTYSGLMSTQVLVLDVVGVSRRHGPASRPTAA